MVHKWPVRTILWGEPNVMPWRSYGCSANSPGIGDNFPRSVQPGAMVPGSAAVCAARVRRAQYVVLSVCPAQLEWSQALLIWCKSRINEDDEECPLGG